eukprot:PLAT6612.1.p1 GENE.PLAT6612.1~~PLAT6612.1.p1  ORF type:complete len:223 (+),score=23.48 PLAT6612.1:52-720(+)
MLAYGSTTPEHKASYDRVCAAMGDPNVSTPRPGGAARGSRAAHTAAAVSLASPPASAPAARSHADVESEKSFYEPSAAGDGAAPTSGKVAGELKTEEGAAEAAGTVEVRVSGWVSLTDENGQYMAYQLEVMTDMAGYAATVPAEYTVLHRYSDFKRLYRAIRERTTGWMPPFPSASLASMLWRDHEPTLKHRATAFARLLSWAANQPHIRSSALLREFLQKR